MANTHALDTERIMAVAPLTEIKEALVNEYRRRIIRCRMVDEEMKKKYGMNYQEFEERNVVKEGGYSWQVETDAMEWEHAIEGLRYAQKKLHEIDQQ